MLRAGERIGPYTLTTKLGQGAFGVVWLAERRTTIAITKVALKIPLDDEVDLETIRQEANLWVQASGHPNVVPIIEADVYDGHIIIASEYAPDGSLETWMKLNGGKAPSAEAAMEMLSGILAGLEHLHSRHIIHRDVKPANILLQGQTPRLADFGISRILKSTSQSSIMAGTPVYMAPEAFDGKRNEQTDIRSVGVILYHLLSGRLPFPQSDMASLIGAIVTKDPDPLPSYISEHLREVVAGTLQKDTTYRYKSATEMRNALRNPNQVTSKRKPTEKSITSPRQSLPQSQQPVVKNQSVPKYIYAIAAALLLLIGGIWLGTIFISKSVNLSPVESSGSQSLSPNKTTRPSIEITESDIEQMIESWKNTWERGDLHGYSMFYDASFSGRNYSQQSGYQSMTRDDWLKDKAQKFRRNAIISVQLGQRRIDYKGDEATVSFSQSYRSNTYTDYGVKTLYLRKGPGGEMRILQEDFTPQTK